MLFMVIERFREMWSQFTNVCGKAGVLFLMGWNISIAGSSQNFARCFQLMRCDDPRLFQEWVLHWRGLGITFEIVPVVPSKETQAVVAPYLDTSGI
jgi:hypothetical protein